MIAAPPAPARAIASIASDTDSSGVDGNLRFARATRERLIGSPLAGVTSEEHRLDIHDRGTVDGFDGTDAQTRTVDGSDDHRMQPKGIRPIRRARGKDASERTVGIRSRVHLEGIAPSAIQPGDDDDLVARSEAEDGLGRPRVHLEPRVWCSLVSLLRRLSP